ncbi:MAG: hypothetical protein NZ527_02765 [Hydrogenobacter thermophilus]|nr:hypothetical protein [Hydrogenobacter thermophilus]
MSKNAFLLLFFLFVIAVSYLLGVLAFSSKEARQKKWEEFRKQYHLSR